MDIALWTAAGLLAAAYLFSGAGKILLPKEKVAAYRHGGWADDFRPGSLKAMGALEAAGALGLVLPALLGIAPVLVPLAAIGLMAVMAGAMAVHLRRGEPRLAAGNFVYFALLAFVAWGRLAAEPFTG
ncbi:DoxX family protein [Streptomonospora nanhaiensis]|uniref:Putative membrane protein YphA (DoxX/SURF4 family) n=1 Tax=Streptomonospora nanhaiensis TaxID=1323731 RepID=A0A853BG74_9ACTN|nr:DoxX family protein [Streptomonospora nanhaiensis]MBV2363182.1 DoxX family protein [Streptomonospora nanhaiensis]NYI94323.1 putative membrane protein YphA (DoxX/SURF4 family) [Streptomonospora nanhaiensis]